MRKGHAVTTLPRWAELLRRERRNAGQPTLRDLADQIDSAHTAIGTWFNGRHIPGDDQLDALLTVLDATPEAHAAIRAAIEQHREHARYRSSNDQQAQDRTGDPVVLAVAINNLATAVNRLTEKLDESLQESRRIPHPDHH